MSWHCISAVYQAKFGSPTRKAIAAKLADWADDDGGSIFPSVRRIADETETSTRTVQYTLREFVAEGLLVVEQEGGKGPGSTTRYRLCLHRLGELPRSRRPLEDKGATVAPLKTTPKRVQPTTAKGATDDKKGAPGAPEPSVEPSIEPNTPPLPPSGGTAQEREDRFDDFWASFPKGKRSHTAKARARDAYVSALAAGITAENLINAARRYARCRPDPDFIPMAVTWLSQERWEDEPAPDKRARVDVTGGMGGGSRVHDTQEPWQVYRNRMILEGKFKLAVRA